jgi:DNA-binding NarL/FixJ family response regulator
MSSVNSHRVLIVEDQQATRERLAGIVATTDGLDLVAALADFRSASEWLQTRPAPAVMLVDLGLPDGDGLDLIRASRGLEPQPEVMVISVFGDERHVVRAIEAGATGYLLKDSTAEEIGQGILRLIDGESPISSSIARHLLKRLQPAAKPSSHADGPHLTRRENDVLQLIAKGFAYAEIAEHLGMSPHTVTSHIKHIYRKLQVRSRGEAVFEAMQLGILESPR